MLELSHRDSLLSFISDAHKDAFGFRPRGMGYNEMSIAELEAEAEYLCKEVENTVERERAAEERARESWEASVAKMIELGAASRLDAVRWLLDAEGFLEYANLDNGYIDDYVNFSLGVSYRYNLLTGENK